MAISDRARDFWDRISPRERKLVVFLVVAVPLAAAIWLGLSIRDGLISMEARNDQHRDALEMISKLKAQGGPTNADPGVKIPDAPIALQSYVAKALEKNGLTNKGGLAQRSVTKNGIVTTTVSCTVNEMSTEQLQAFLQDIETAEKTVAVTNLEVKRSRRDDKKVDATLDISTYSNAEKPKSEDEKKEGDTEKEGG